MLRTSVALLTVSLLLGAQQGSGLDDQILEKGDKLLEEAKAVYEEARSKSSVAAFVEAGFKLEEARIKFIVLQEIGSPEKQKTATDRLRAINQLSKLIHDGKVAISGSPPDSVPAKPVDPLPATPGKEVPPVPPDKPAVSLPAVPPVDVTKRAPVPDPAKQREAEKLVKELFKDQYSKKTPSDRKALAKLLLEQGGQSQADPAVMWVLYREAQDVALQVAAVDLAIKGIEETARIFDVDALLMKTTALGAAAKTAKTPDEFGALAESILKHVEELVRADQYDSADKLMTASVQSAKKTTDSGLIARATTRAKEVAEAKSLYQSEKGVLQTLAKTPDDPGANLEMGKFLCFVKGSWDLGLRFLVKGSDEALKSLAEKELSIPAQVTERVSLADGWYDLSVKDKSALRKSQLLAHARAVYESTLADAPTLVRVKIEKRLETLDQSVPTTGTAGPINLLPLIDIKKDAVIGSWTANGRSLTSPGSTEHALVHVPYSPPEEFELKVVAIRKSGSGPLDLGLYANSRQFLLVTDGFGGDKSGIDLIDGANASANETTYKGRLLEIGVPTTILCSVRKTALIVSVNGKKIIEWKPRYDRLSLGNYYNPPNKKSLIIGTHVSEFEISSYLLTPISGPGTKLNHATDK
jgi:hypothetical protein